MVSGQVRTNTELTRDYHNQVNTVLITNDVTVTILKDSVNGAFLNQDTNGKTFGGFDLIVITNNSSRRNRVALNSNVSDSEGSVSCVD